MQARSFTTIMFAALCSCLMPGLGNRPAVGPEVLHSSDGGKSWAAQAPAQDPQGKPFGLRALWLSPGGEIVVVGDLGGERGQILRSRDRGRSWKSQSVAAPLTGVSGAEGVIYAVDDRGGILRGEGETLQALTARAAGPLYGVWAASRGELYLAGSAGVMRSTDGGASFVTQELGPTLTAVWGSAATGIYAVGHEGTIVHSADHGGSWQRQASGVTVTLNGVFGRGREVYVVGAQGTVLFSSDSGASWSAQPCATKESLRGVWGDSAGSLYAVTDQGTLLRGPGAFAVIRATDDYGRYGIGGLGSDIYAVGKKLDHPSRYNIR